MESSVLKSVHCLGEWEKVKLIINQAFQLILSAKSRFER